MKTTFTAVQCFQKERSDVGAPYFKRLTFCRRVSLTRSTGIFGKVEMGKWKVELKAPHSSLLTPRSSLKIASINPAVVYSLATAAGV